MLKMAYFELEHVSGLTDSTSQTADHKTTVHEIIACKDCSLRITICCQQDN